MNILERLIGLLSADERRRGGRIFIFVVLIAIFETIALGSVIPFMAALANPAIMESNNPIGKLRDVVTNSGLIEKDRFLVLLSLCVTVFFVASNILRAFTAYVVTRFTLMLEASIGSRLVERYLNQPYAWFLYRNSSDLGKTILSEIGSVVEHGYRPMATIVSQLVVCIFLFGLLLIVDPAIAIAVTFTLATAYFVAFKVTRTLMVRLSKDRTDANRDRYYFLSQAFGAIKEVKVNGLEDLYKRRFNKPAKTYARSHALAQITSQLPRYAIEAISIGGVLFTCTYLVSKDSNFSNAIPILALYAFAGLRLLPALQQIYSSATLLRYAGESIDQLQTELVNLSSFPINEQETSFRLRIGISLEGVCFKYPGSERPILRDVNLYIPAGSKVGFVGATGGGKTTTADLIIGILDPVGGRITVDGVPISNSNKRSWQRITAYVPQNIYVTDDTVKNNISLSLGEEDVDQTAVEVAAGLANIDEFVRYQMPMGYNTPVGEGGVRLSGGQRQRLGIARALYKRPKLLVLDEATSALDTITEENITNSINALGDEITVIIIAHRLRTIEHCDKIVLFEDGRVVAQGSYQDLERSSKEFNRYLSKVNPQGG